MEILLRWMMCLILTLETQIYKFRVLFIATNSLGYCVGEKRTNLVLTNSLVKIAFHKNPEFKIKPRNVDSK